MSRENHEFSRRLGEYLEREKLSKSRFAGIKTPPPQGGMTTGPEAGDEPAYLRQQVLQPPFFFDPFFFAI